MKAFSLLIVFFSFLVSANGWTQTQADHDPIPPSLKAWEAWVLHGYEDRLCPKTYNDKDNFKCIWPSRLKLKLNAKTGRFTQEWLVFKKGWIPLPGSKKTWPEHIESNGQPLSFVERNGVPFVFLNPGLHVIEGVFEWNRLPEAIRIPKSSGLVDLWIDDRQVKSPLLDKNSQLWIQRQKKLKSREDKFDVKVYRLINDSIPMEITTLFRINVSGESRNLKLKGSLLDGFIPFNIHSDLPSRLSPDGDLIVQARPGQWEIKVSIRSKGPVHEISTQGTVQQQEVWAFQLQNHFRMVKIENIPAIDPGQTDLPSAWKHLPAYIVNPDDTLVFKEMRRGDPDPAPDQLHLERTLWLDFDGKGFTIHDRVKGIMSRQWYLAMNPPCTPGRITVDGKDQLITHQGDGNKPGVELRRGKLDLKSDSRIDSKLRSLPAVGWDHDFQSVSGSFHLSPGWDLIGASGVDVMEGTWFEKWTLLDFFIVLIISLAIFKLWNLKWGIFALLIMVITYHEPGAPRLVWLHFLSATALLRLLPENWFSKLIKIWRLGSILTLIVLVIPFFIQQVRWGFYPQLESVGYPSFQYGGLIAPGSPQKQIQDEVLLSEEMIRKESPRTKAKRKTYAPAKIMKSDDSLSRQKTPVSLVQDPNALIQTGPGLPEWKWRSYTMKWNGPVNRNQEIRFWLISPLANLILSLARVLMMMVLLLYLLGIKDWKIPSSTLIKAGILLFLVYLPCNANSENNGPGFPPSHLLDQLRDRLLEEHECFPRCADSPLIKLNITSDKLQVLYFVHSATDTAVPLPGSSELWRSGEILLDDEKAKGIAGNEDGMLFIFIPEGIHKIFLSGDIPFGNEFNVSLPLKPHRIMFQGTGWDAKGIDKEGRVEGDIKLIRQKKETVKQALKDSRILPPFLKVERIISFGLEWRIHTIVSRMTQTGMPVMVQIPLIPGESVTTAGVLVENKEVLAQMDAKTTRIHWNSTLERNTELTLKAPEAVQWFETWRFDISPIWHCEFTGIPVIHHQNPSGNWNPRWHPWPGESITIKITRPKAVRGQIKTIDKTRLTFTPGQRYNKTDLFLRLRSSQGGQHRIKLPENSSLQQVKINGKTQPVKSKDNQITLPIKPGSQTIDIKWHNDITSRFLIKSPTVHMNQEAVNTDISFKMPRNRWILMTFGPRMGPAVLFWSYLAVIVLGAIGLGKITWTPLKTRHWILLGLGLTQVHPLVVIAVAGWLLALGLRGKYTDLKDLPFFNLKQSMLVILTVFALTGLYFAIQNGLLGIPHMQISGNGSNNFNLNWTQDRISGDLPQPFVLCLPLFVFRTLMLLWALWLAHSLLKWLKWGWTCFSEGGTWKKVVLRRKKKRKADPQNQSGPA